MKPESFTLDSNLPYTLAFVAYRLPGTDSPDYAATRVLADVLASQRGDLYALVPAGKALYARSSWRRRYPKASVGFGIAALPASTAPTGVVADMRSIVANYVREGVPAELVEAAKRSEIASAHCSGAIRSRIWPRSGRRRWPRKAATRRTMTSTRSGV